jgi:hypothetical protein
MVQQWSVVRSRVDGQYLVARLKSEDGQPKPHLIVFSEHADALTYLNRHAPDLADQFAVETLTQPQLPALLKRWSYQGVAIVEDPWLPTLKFGTINS